MLRIHFTYTSSEICPSVYFLLFFRLTGAYLYESYFDSDAQKQGMLLNCLPEDAEIEKRQVYDAYDLELYYIANNEEYEKYACEVMAMPEKDAARHILVCSHEVNRAESPLLPAEGGSAKHSIVVHKAGAEFATLRDVLDELLHREIIFGDEYADLRECLQLYEKYRIWELSLQGRFFYAAKEDKEDYVRIRGRFVKASKAYFEEFMSGGGWRNAATLHLQYAFLNLAYEGNLYCIRGGGPMIYTADSLARMCRSLLQSLDEEGWKGSFSLLLAQVYDDLLMDYNKAFEYYIKCCNDFNAYAYYRKGIIFQDQAGDYEKALKYYLISAQIYPEYYRAWYRIGRCYMLLDRYRDALEAFRNIMRILEPRLNADVLRPMEIEYLFKAQNQCAYICNKALGRLGQSVIENQIAVKVWKTINTSSFFQQAGYAKRPRQLWERTKKELCVRKIYDEIVKLAVKLEDNQLKRNTQEEMALYEGECSERYG